MSLDQTIAQHYAAGPEAATVLGERILRAARGAAADPERLQQSDLAAVDEFHIGGLAATVHFTGQLALAADARWLDVGCGIGGTARYVAATHGCQVTGIDLTPAYCEVASLLADRVGLRDRVAFQAGSALEMPFADASFDGAFTLHVGMNIPDKLALYREVARVLRPGAVFGLYDVLAGDRIDALAFPVPWSSTPETSFLASIDEMRSTLEDAGLTVETATDRRAFALDFFEQLRAKASGGPPPLGLHLLMGETFPQKVANMVENIRAGRCGPWELICRKAGR
ncbi:MAG: methyltransferase domain-containing protein [Myxococcota bacterium]|nr:methyltransferase domain-containing protein [Myxococcota bacterium]